MAVCLFWWRWHRAVSDLSLPACVTDSHRLSSRSTFSFCLVRRKPAASASPVRNGDKLNTYASWISSPLAPFYRLHRLTFMATSPVCTLLCVSRHHIFEVEQYVLPVFPYFQLRQVSGPNKSLQVYLNYLGLQHLGQNLHHDEAVKLFTKSRYLGVSGS